MLHVPRNDSIWEMQKSSHETAGVRRNLGNRRFLRKLVCPMLCVALGPPYVASNSVCVCVCVRALCARPLVRVAKNVARLWAPHVPSHQFREASESALLRMAPRIVREVPDTLNFLRRALRAILSVRPKCSHRCFSLKESPFYIKICSQHTRCSTLGFAYQARKTAQRLTFWVRRPPGGWESSTRRGGGQKIRALPRKFVFLGFRREASGMSQEFCRDVPDPWGCSKSLCQKVRAHFRSLA